MIKSCVSQASVHSGGIFLLFSSLVIKCALNINNACLMAAGLGRVHGGRRGG